MQKIKLKPIVILMMVFFCSYHSAQINDIIKKAEKTIDKYTNGNKQNLTEEEIVQGLKEALSVGTQSAVSTSSKPDGYLKNPRLFIPFPPEAKEMKEKLIRYGFSEKVNEFEISLNRAAENAAKDATPVFITAIKQMSIKDAVGILKGTDTSATHYLKKNTYDSLYQKFLPVVKKSVNEVKVTNYWKPLISVYNKLPNKKKYNPDLDKYITERAINGLFILIADEEKNIRKNPAARISEILKKVFTEK